MNLIYPATFAARHFDEAARPDPRTIRRWVRDGLLPGREIAGRCYVDEEAFLNSTGDALADRILAEG